MKKRTVILLSTLLAFSATVSAGPSTSTLIAGSGVKAPNPALLASSNSNSVLTVAPVQKANPWLKQIQAVEFAEKNFFGAALLVAKNLRNDQEKLDNLYINLEWVWEELAPAEAEQLLDLTLDKSRGIPSNPDKFTLLWFITQKYLEGGNPEYKVTLSEIEEFADQLTGVNRIRLADLYGMIGNHDRQNQLLAQVAREATDAEVREKLAQSYAEIGRYEQALELLQGIETPYEYGIVELFEEIAIFGSIARGWELIDLLETEEAQVTAMQGMAVARAKLGDLIGALQIYDEMDFQSELLKSGTIQEIGYQYRPMISTEEKRVDPLTNHLLSPLEQILFYNGMVSAYFAEEGQEEIGMPLAQLEELARETQLPELYMYLANYYHLLGQTTELERIIQQTEVELQAQEAGEELRRMIRELQNRVYNRQIDPAVAVKFLQLLEEMAPVVEGVQLTSTNQVEESETEVAVEIKADTVIEHEAELEGDLELATEAEEEEDHLAIIIKPEKKKAVTEKKPDAGTLTQVEPTPADQAAEKALATRVEYLLKLADLYLEIEALEEGQGVFDQISHLVGHLPKGELRVKALVGLARGRVAQSEYAAGVALAEEAGRLARQLKLPTYWQDLKEIYEDAGDYEHYQKLVQQKVIYSQNQQAQDLFYLGKSKIRQGQFAEADELFLEALELRSGQGYHLHSLQVDVALEYGRVGELTRAKAMITALEQERVRLSALPGLLDLYQEKDDVAYLELAQGVAESSTDPYLRDRGLEIISLELMKQGQMRESFQFLRKMNDLYELSYTLTEMGIWYLEEDQPITDEVQDEIRKTLVEVIKK